MEVVAIAGSSMGALVGGVFAAGKLDEYTEWVLGLSQIDVLRLLDLSLSSPGAIRAEKVFARVHDLLDGALIEDLPIPYTAVATDLLGRKEVWFQRGSMEVAIRASTAIPSFITPIMLNGRLLADGGMMNPVPIAPTASVHADATIAVSLHGEPRGEGGAPERAVAEERAVDEWADRFKRGASTILDSDMVRSFMHRFGGSGHDEFDPAGGVDPAHGDPDDGETVAPVDAETEPFGPLPAGLSKLDVMNLSLDAMQSVLQRYRLAGYPPDVLVSVPKDACRTLDFHKAADMIELGRTLTAAALDAAGLTGEVIAPVVTLPANPTVPPLDEPELVEGG